MVTTDNAEERLARVEHMMEQLQRDSTALQKIARQAVDAAENAVCAVAAITTKANPAITKP